LDPGRIAQIKSRDDYLALLKTRLAHDEIFYLNKLGEVLWVDVLPLTGEVMAAGQARWSEDKRREALLKAWLPPEGPPARIVLVGLFIKGLTKEDVLTNGRIRLQLRSGGQVLDALAVEEVKPDIWWDYYPVFNRWEKVFAVRFPANTPDDGSLVISWPAGSRELSLAPAPVSAKNS
jgi:hypothetical protein